MHEMLLASNWKPAVMRYDLSNSERTAISRDAAKQTSGVARVDGNIRLRFWFGARQNGRTP
jgi:hypothetical protein